MRKLLTVCTFMFLFFSSEAQFKAGVLAGMSTFDVNDNDINIFDENGVKQFSLLLKNGAYGYHVGVFTQFELGTFIIRPEFIFNSISADFQVFDVEDPNIATQVFSESYQYFDIPLMFGVKMGPVRFNGGPVGHVFLNSTSDLFKFSEYSQTFKDMIIGWQAGIGLDIWKFSIDMRYEDNFTNFGEHIRFFGTTYAFSDRPSRLIGTVGFRF